MLPRRDAAFEDIRIIRDMRNTANRLVNCENANINSRICSHCQIEEIQYIEDTVGLAACQINYRILSQKSV